MIDKKQILSLHIHQLSFREAMEYVVDWATKKMPSFVCFANVHMTIEAYKDKSFAEQLQRASLVLADGKPIAIACKLLHNQRQERISGMDFTPAIFKKASENNLNIFLYGSTQEVLQAIQKNVEKEYPAARIVGAISPPFRPLQPAEIDAHIDIINQSGTNLVLISLGCPKQEKWMYQHSKKINAVLLGVGGAFPVMAGLQKRAPAWMQKTALEWLYRLLQEPGRMFKRYVYTNSLFLYLLAKKLLKIS